MKEFFVICANAAVFFLSQKKGELFMATWPLSLFDFLKWFSLKMDYNVCNTECSTYACVHKLPERASRRITYTVSCSCFPATYFQFLLNLCVKQETWSGQLGLGCMITIAFLFFFQCRM